MVPLSLEDKRRSGKLRNGSELIRQVPAIVLFYYNSPAPPELIGDGKVSVVWPHWTGFMKRFFRYTGWVLGGLLFLLSGPILLATSGSLQGAESWQTATRESAGIAPSPGAAQEAIVQVYGARAWSWRGYFAVHTWIATKEKGADHYQVHQVIGWRNHVVNSGPGEPDRHWYGARPELYADIRGALAEKLIPRIYEAVDSYPFPTEYQAWPGPNSNTFVAWVIRQVPGLDVALPNHAIGKDYLVDQIVAEVPGGAGYQVSFGGYFGLLAGVREGVELNVLGLSFGINPLALGIKLPGIGELALRNTNPMPSDSDQTAGAGWEL